MNIIIPGMDMDSADKRATCARCKCVYEFSLDEAQVFRSIVDFYEEEPRKLLTAFSVVHMVAKCPSCGKLNLVEDHLSVPYSDMIDSILKEYSVTYSDIGGEDWMERPEIKEIDSATAEQIIFSREPLGLFWLKENGVYVGIDNSTGEAWTEEFESFVGCLGWIMRNNQLSSDEPVGNPDKLKQDRQKDLIDNVLMPFAGWIFGFCEDCNDADACKDCQLSDLCQRGLYPSKIADAINEIANDFKPVEIDQFKISIDK